MALFFLEPASHGARLAGRVIAISRAKREQQRTGNLCVSEERRVNVQATI
jgi:hypothetical protein